MENTQRKLNIRFVGWFFLFNALFFLFLGFDYFKSIVQSPTLFQNLIFDYTSIQGKILVLSFVLTTYIGYMILLAFIPASIVGIIATFFVNKSFVKYVSIIIAAISIFILLIDIYIYSRFKFHLNLTILQMLFSIDARDFLDLSFFEILYLTFILLFIFVLELALASLVWHFIVLPEKYKYGTRFAAFWVGASLWSYLTLMVSIFVYHSCYATTLAAP